MLIKRIGIFVAIIIVAIIAYNNILIFKEDPNISWYAGAAAVALLYCVKLLYDDYNIDVITERQYDQRFKNAVGSLASAPL